MNDLLKKTRASWPRIMLVMMLVLMVWQIPKMLDLEPLNRLTVPMAALWAAAGFTGVVLFHLWKEPRTLLLLLGLCWMGGTSLLRGTLWNDLYTYVPLACALLFCYNAPCAVDLPQMKKLVSATCIVWVLWMTVLSGVALYAAYTGVHVRQTSWERFIGINDVDLRLYMMDLCTNAGGNLLTAILAALGIAVCTKKRAMRIVCVLCVPVLLTALSLTDARASFIGSGVGIGAGAACGVFHALRRQKRVTRYLAAFACAAAVLLLVYMGVSSLTNIAGSFVPAPAAETVSAQDDADDAEASAVAHRELGSGAGLLNRRDDIWRGVLSFLKAEPKYLLTGTGPSSLMEKAAPYVVSEVPEFKHSHCIWLQILGSYGIPGLVIALAFTALFVTDAWRLLFMGDRPRWSRLLPVPAIAVYVCELAECLTLGRVNGPILILLFFFMGASSAARKLTDRA